MASSAHVAPQSKRPRPAQSLEAALPRLEPSADPVAATASSRAAFQSAPLFRVRFLVEPGSLLECARAAFKGVRISNPCLTVATLAANLQTKICLVCNSPSFSSDLLASGLALLLNHPLPAGGTPAPLPPDLVLREQVRALLCLPADSHQRSAVRISGDGLTPIVTIRVCLRSELEHSLRQPRVPHNKQLSNA